MFILTLNIARTVLPVPQMIQDFVSKLLRVDPVERMTAAHASNHPWLVTSNLPSGTNSNPGRLKTFKLYQAKRKLRSAVQVVGGV